MRFKHWMESRETEGLLQAFIREPSAHLFAILGDAMEDEGNPNSQLIRNDALFDKKFTNWYGKHLFPRQDGERRQLTMQEFQWLTSIMPKLRQAVYTHSFRSGSTSFMLAGEAFLDFLEIIVSGKKV